MEELLSLIKAIAELPTMALWVLGGYLVYRLAILGSAYATVRFVAAKLHDAYVVKQQAKSTVLYAWKDGIEPISESTKNAIIASLIRLKLHGKANRYSNLDYVHDSFAEELDMIVNDHILKLAKPAAKI